MCHAFFLTCSRGLEALSGSPLRLFEREAKSRGVIVFQIEGRLLCALSTLSNLVAAVVAAPLGLIGIVVLFLVSSPKTISRNVTTACDLLELSWNALGWSQASAVGILFPEFTKNILEEIRSDSSYRPMPA